MANTITSSTLGRHIFLTNTPGATPWSVNCAIDSCTAGQIIKAAPSSGNLYIQEIFLQQMAADKTVWFDERLTGSATGAVARIFGPIMSEENSPTSHTIRFIDPIKITAGDDFIIDQEAAGSAFVYVQGFTAAIPT